MYNGDPYNELVRQYFMHPAHAGRLAADGAGAAPAEAGAAAAGATVRLMLAQRDGRIDAIRFQAWGCPHLIAAAEVACERLTGEPLAELARFEPRQLMQALAVPVEKTGQLLLLEDALRSLYRVAAASEQGKNG
ncbi:MAG: hypothetical protein BMS9Abin32_722 [Gammaproteobacteria bacterium]|nr:MAG: hypothetical protein BMS9Abin32_722 [Gammaproteobacteria bacterium]